MKKMKASAKVTDTSSNNPAASGVVATLSDAVVTECVGALDQVAAMLGDGEPLDSVQIRHSTKMPKGGAGIIPQLLALCQQHGVTTIGPLTTTEMSQTFDRGNAINQVGSHVDVVRKKVGDLALGSHGRTWQIATTMYGTLRRMAADDPNLALGLEPIKGYFKKPRKAKTAEQQAVAAAKKAAKAAIVAKESGAKTPSPTALDAAPAPAEANGANGSAQAAPPAPEAPSGAGTPVTPAPAAH